MFDGTRLFSDTASLKWNGHFIGSLPATFPVTIESKFVTSLFTVLFQAKQNHIDSLMRHPAGLVFSGTADSATST